jgi:2'-5' RNA ligase
MARHFFAAWPDPAAAEALAALARQAVETCGGRPVPVGKLHLTLAFLGEVEPARIPALASCVPVRAAAFRFDLDRLGCFRRAGVAWAGSSAPARELLRMQEKLTGRLAGAGFAVEDREYTPHVTLARRIERALPAAAVPPIAWNVNALTLVRSEPGTGRYTIVERWPLGA